MFCESCGNQIRDGAVFCDRCGQRVAPVPAPSGPQPGPAPMPSPMPKQGPLAPFVLILAVCLFWFVWHGFLLWCASAREGYVVITPAVPPATSFGLSCLVWLAGLLSVLILAGQKKITPRAFCWKDVAPMALLCLFVPVIPLVLQNLSSHLLGQAAWAGYALFLDVERSPVLSALSTGGLWLVCIAGMLVRSGRVRVTWKKALLCLGALICLSLMLATYCPMAVQDYFDLYHGGIPEILQCALEMTYPYFFFLWVKWTVLLWFAADCGSGALHLGGRLAFAGVVIIGGISLCPRLLMAVLRYGARGAALTVPAAFLLGAAVLLVFRLVHHIHAVR